ncbi:ATP-dependent RNA helicase SrmB [Ferrimonas pelagia]|uniref:ATP-dependent RNA helicase SrmB n=1 Tax=Ferrimonas pelagia TaxID=1177826 RepID=A0ABP9EI83_9GAMM
MSFPDLDLDPRLERALLDAGYQKPTTIQSAVLEAALEQRDIMASAPTGTGKTAAFLLPALQHLLDFPRRDLGHARILILTPTRELAEQVCQYGKKLMARTELTVGSIVGGRDFEMDADLLRGNLDILVATPGRLIQYLEDEKFDPRQVEMLIIDEADRMLDMGFMPAVERIAGEVRWRKQTMLFSATLEGRGLDSFVERLLESPITCEAKPPRSERKKINQLAYRADDAGHKFKLLTALMAQEDCERSIIFVRTKERATELHAKLFAKKFRVAVLQGGMTQAKRDDALLKFKEGRVKHLIATDVAARGLDVPEISHVFNYDMPRSGDVYLHRIGRTARAGAKGTAVSLVEAHDHPMLQKVQRYTEEGIRSRFVDGLRPTSKEPRFTKPKKSKSAAKAKAKSGKKKKSGGKVRSAKK